MWMQRGKKSPEVKPRTHGNSELANGCIYSSIKRCTEDRFLSLGGVPESCWQNTVGPGSGPCSEYRLRPKDSCFYGEGTRMMCGTGRNIYFVADT